MFWGFSEVKIGWGFWPAKPAEILVFSEVKTGFRGFRTPETPVLGVANPETPVLAANPETPVLGVATPETPPPC